MDICLICGESYPPNDLIVCQECNEDGARACGACGQLYTDQHADSEGLHFLIYCNESEAEPSTATEYDNGTSLTPTK